MRRERRARRSGDEERRGRWRVFCTLSRQTRVANSSSAHCMKSLNAASPKPRQCRKKAANDTAAWMPTRQTNPTAPNLKRSDIDACAGILERFVFQKDVTSVIGRPYQEIGANTVAASGSGFATD